MTDLRPFTNDATCPKCGSGKIRSRWYGHVLILDDVEHMDRRCRSCGYEWLEAPLDGGAATTPAEADDDEPDAYLAAKLAGGEATNPYDTELRKELDDLADYLMAKWPDRIEEDFGAVDEAISIMEEFRTAPRLDIEPSIPVSRIVAVLAEWRQYHARETADRRNYLVHLAHRWECDSIAEMLDIQDAYRAELARQRAESE